MPLPPTRAFHSSYLTIAISLIPRLSAAPSWRCSDVEYFTSGALVVRAVSARALRQHVDFVSITPAAVRNNSTCFARFAIASCAFIISLSPFRLFFFCGIVRFAMRSQRRLSFILDAIFSCRQLIYCDSLARAAFHTLRHLMNHGRVRIGCSC